MIKPYLEWQYCDLKKQLNKSLQEFTKKKKERKEGKEGRRK